MSELNQEIQEIFNYEIARELLIEVAPNINEEQIKKIWSACGGNPWNAVPIYSILEAANANI